MIYRQSHHSRRVAPSGIATMSMLVMMLTAAATGAFASHDRVPIVSVAAQTAEAPERPWQPAQVRMLIATIEESEKRGFDPSRYGIAALRSELDQSTELFGRAGTHQLDVLARTAAIALADDYRRRLNARPVDAAELDAARRAGRLRSWLVAGADVVGGTR